MGGFGSEAVGRCRARQEPWLKVGPLALCVYGLGQGLQVIDLLLPSSDSSVIPLAAPTPEFFMYHSHTCWFRRAATDGLCQYHEAQLKRPRNPKSHRLASVLPHPLTARRSPWSLNIQNVDSSSSKTSLSDSLSGNGIVASAAPRNAH